MPNVFVSFDHDDQKQIGGFKSLKNNPRHPLDFRDHSLKAPARPKREATELPSQRPAFKARAG